MSTYIEIDFEGEYDELLKFMEDKGWDFNAKRVDKLVAYFKISNDLKEEIEFFKGFELESTNTIISSISEITLDDFENAEEYSEQKFKPTFVPPQEDPEILESEREPLKNKEEETSAFWKTEETKDDVKFDSSEIKAKLSQLPQSLTKLKEDDPMYSLTSSAFMKKFLVITSAILLILSIIN